MLPALRQRNIHNFLLVTSDYHTARARRFISTRGTQHGRRTEMRVVASPRSVLHAGRLVAVAAKGRKTAFMEWTKTVSGALGI